MFDHIAGELVHKELTQAVIRAGGVGYFLSIPVSTYEALPAQGHVTVYTHLAVRENEMRLFGFASVMERELFRILMEAPGIGPSTALAIMSGTTADNLSRAVMGEDYEALEMIRGIGPKTARRLVAEIKQDIEAFRDRYLGPAPVAGIERDACMALVSLGFPKNTAQQAVKKAHAADPKASVEELVRSALRSC